MNIPSGSQRLPAVKGEVRNNPKLTCKYISIHLALSQLPDAGTCHKKYIKIDHKLFPPNFRRNLSKNWDSFWDFNPPLGGPRCKFTHPSSKDAMVVVNGAVGSLGPTPGCWCDGHWKLDGPLGKGKIHETLEKDRCFFLVGGGMLWDSADHDVQPDSAMEVRNFCV